MRNSDNLAAELAAKGIQVNEGRTVGEAMRDFETPAPISEKAFQASVILVARRNGWLVYHTFDSRKSAAGFPDLVLVRGKKTLFRELKVGKNAPSAEQLNWLESLAAAGQDARVWYPSDYPLILSELA